MLFDEPPQLPKGLPALDSAGAAHLSAVQAHLVDQVRAYPHALMPFDEWMDRALYAPGLGYYTAGSAKFGGAALQGDFTTAPELTPLFGQTLAQQIAQVLQACGTVNVLEFGAGSGALAASVIPALRALGLEPAYFILEVSPDLRERQQARLAALSAEVTWLETLPTDFMGCVVANEVLDAMPAKLFRWGEPISDSAGRAKDAIAPTPTNIHTDPHDGSTAPILHEIHVGLDAAATSNPDQSNSLTAEGEPALPFRFVGRPADPGLVDAVAPRLPPYPGYQSEINLRAEAWVRQMGAWLTKGVALLIDYGFPQREYYHPQRAEGTLMCHFRHHAHSQPLIYPGLQDITTHVDFTAMADAALDGGLDVLGYTSQARFLTNAGLIQILAQLDQEQSLAHAQAMASVQKLVSEAEMGELFKVLAVGRGIDHPLIGFATGDRRGRL